MRLVKLAIAMLAVASASPALAQSAYDGPLAAPDTPAAAPTTPPGHSKSKPKKVRHAAAKPAVPDSFGAPPTAAASEPARPVRKGPADDPLSLGMKWTGNNDSVAQTRSQNLGGDSFGSGAEVGMKLHF